MKWSVDKLSSWWNNPLKKRSLDDHLTKSPAEMALDVMVAGLNNYVTKGQVDKITSI